MEAPSTIAEPRSNTLLANVFDWLRGIDVPFRVVGRTRHGVACAGGDIDILVPPDRLDAVGNAFPGHCAGDELPLVRRLRHAQGFRFDLAWIGENQALDTLPIDFSSDLCSGARRLVSATELLSVAPAGDTGDGLLRLPPALEFHYYLAKKIDKGRLDALEADYLGHQWRADPAGCRDRIASIVPAAQAQAIAEAAASGDWDPVRGHLGVLRGILRAGAPVKISPVGRLIGAAATRLLLPAGLVVALTGPAADGDRLQLLLAGLYPTTVRLVAGGRTTGWLMIRVLPLRLRNTLVILDGWTASPESTGGWRQPDLVLENGARPDGPWLLRVLQQRYGAG